VVRPEDRTLLACAALLALALPTAAAPTPQLPGWSVTLVTDSLSAPVSMTTDPATGDLYVYEADLAAQVAVVVRIRGDGTQTRLYTGAFGCTRPYMTFDADAQRLWMSDCSGTLVLSPQGGVLAQDAFPGAAIVRAPDHRLYQAVPGAPFGAGVGGCAIEQIDETTLARQAACAVPGTLWRWYDGDLVADAAGHLYVGDGGDCTALACGASLGAGQVDGFRTACVGGQIYLNYFDEVLVRPAGPGGYVAFATGFAATVVLAPGPGGGLDVLDYKIPSPGSRGSVWRFTPAGATPVRATSWGRLKSVYR